MQHEGADIQCYNTNMEFTERKRLEYALAIKEADRVPIELWIPDNLKVYPKAQRLVELVDEYCGAFKGPNIVNSGLFGVPGEFSSAEISRDKIYTYTENRHITENGIFSQIVQRDQLNTQYCHFKKQYFHEIEDLERFSACDFPNILIPSDYENQVNEICENKFMPTIAFAHPFGTLARNAPPEKFYMWLHTHTDTIHMILQKMYAQINKAIEDLGLPFVYYFCALEMAIEPWMGREMFDEFIYDYDVIMNKKIHKAGGIIRHHAHGPVFKHLEHWHDMGIDSLEPMEMAPLGDTVLSEAKKLMGKRMSFGGNIPSQRFVDISKDEIESMVAKTIETCAVGGGFILKGASSVCGLNSFKTLEQLDRIIESTEHFINSGLKYGKY